MQFVTKPDRFSQDAIIPGRLSDPRGFVDTGNVLDGIRGPLPIYLSAEGIRLAAQRYPQLELVDASAHQAVVQALAQAEAERDEVTQQRDEALARLERISGLKRDGFQVTRVQGRPKQKVEVGA